VTTARLVPHGPDLWFVLEVRAPVEPAVSVDAKKEGGATLSIASRRATICRRRVRSRPRANPPPT